MGLLRDVPVTKVKEFEKDFIEMLELKHRDILDNLRDGILNDNVTGVLQEVAAETALKFKV
jgi:F-type H+-transporting ATPase subunit alpha